jgi:hypothetical protein
VKPRQIARIVLALAGAVLPLGPLTGAAPASGVAEIPPPRQTGVLLLPPIDATVDSARLAPLRQQIVRLQVQYQFIARQFKVLGEALAVRAAAASPAVDLDDPGARTARNLDELAARAGAQWVVSVIVLQVASAHSPAGLFQARSTIRLQIRDASRHAWLVDQSGVGSAEVGGPPGWLFNASLRSAAGKSVAQALQDYPLVVTVSQAGSIVDYLAGQTEPMVGEAGKPFSGIEPKKPAWP